MSAAPRTPTRRTNRAILYPALAIAAIFLAALSAFHIFSRPDAIDEANPLASEFLPVVDPSLEIAADPVPDFEFASFGIPAIDEPRAIHQPQPEIRVNDALDRLDAQPFRFSQAEEGIEHAFFADARLKAHLATRAFEPGYVAGSTLSIPIVGRRRGATPAARKAIDDALTWLVAHQAQDGSWSFGHRDGECNGRCPDAGNAAHVRTAATGLALLALVRSGHARSDAEHFIAAQKASLYFVGSRANTIGSGITWHDDDTSAFPYAHAIATLALCEAFHERSRARANLPATSNRASRQRTTKHEFGMGVDMHGRVAQAAVDLIPQIQHEAGGWRYTREMPGDTSVTTWMLMALRSARAANLRVPGDTILRANNFLATTAARDNRPLYFYQPDHRQVASETKATTAMGWLCRLSLGTPPDHPATLAAADQLLAWGPQIGDRANFYYNYHATQVLRIVGGKHWKAWHAPLRDYLVATQTRTPRDHAFGSWYVATDPGSTPGGRLYCTALAALTLQEICDSADPRPLTPDP